MTEQTTPPDNPPDLSLRHLQAEFARIDFLLRYEVQRWRLANQEPGDTFRGFYVSHEDAEKLLERAFGTSWGQTTALSPEQRQIYGQAQAYAQKKIQKCLELAQNEGQTLRLLHLKEAFGLSLFELDTLLIGLAPMVDLRYEQVYGYLQDHVARRRPTVNLVLNLLGGPGPDRLQLMSYFSEEAPLFKHQLLKPIIEPGQVEPPLLSQALIVDKTIVSWLWGDYHPHPDLGPNAILTHPQPGELDLLLTPTLRQNLAATTAINPIVVFYGPDKGSQQTAAKFIALQLERPLLMVDLTNVVGDRFSPLQALRLVLRDARLTGAVPCLFGWDLCLEEKQTPAHLLAELCDYPDVVILAGQIRWNSGGTNRGRSLFWQEFPLPDYAQRRELWHYYLKTKLNGREPAQLDISQLADQFYLTSDQIRDAATTAWDMIVQHNKTLQIDDLFSAARTHSSTRLSDLAQKITPRYEWNDIILPDDQVTLLHEIVNTVRNRARVLAEWGVGHKLVAYKGVTMLFAGPPGTGKTMAAEVIAHDLGLDLYKIDLSTVVSKYIGETEKNLERIFREAETSNAILFFDEADSLFGKRSEVRDSHDRYANIEISYLLQRMEAHNGITILATNLRANLDEAFTRRLQFSVGFPFPEAEERRRIWQTLFPVSLPCHTEVNLDLLADQYELAGGNIRNVIVNAAYLAAADENEQVTMAHLRHSIRRERQKMGHLVRELH